MSGNLSKVSKAYFFNLYVFMSFMVKMKILHVLLCQKPVSSTFMSFMLFMVKMRFLRIFPLLALLLAGCKKPDYQNVLLITVDGLRADAAGCTGGAAVTPALDRLAREGVYFDRLATPVPLTLPAHASLLTGINPPEHGLRINGFGRLPPAIGTITESFAAANFATAAFLTSPRLAALHGLDRAFGTYDAPTPQAAHALLLHAPLALTPDPAGASPAAPLPPPFPDSSDAAAAGRFRAWLGTLKPEASWFAWVQLSAPALPRCDAAGKPLTAADTNGYLQAVTAVDATIGTVLDALAASPGAARTVVFVTASSGESLGENDEFGHGLLLRAPTRHVPGWLRLPDGQRAGTRVSFSASLVQIAPTLLDLAAVKPQATQQANWSYLRWLDEAKPIPIPATPGSFYTPCRSDSLAPLLHGYVQGADAAVYCETEYAYALLRWQPLAALQVGNWIYIANEPPELYDLNDDPHERANLASALHDSVVRLDIRLDRLKEAMANRPPIDTSESNVVWQTMASLGASGQSPNATRTRTRRSRIGLSLQERKVDYPALDAALAAEVFRLYPLIITTNRSPATRERLDTCIARSPKTARFYVWRAELNSGDTNALELVIADLSHAAELEPEDAEISALLGKAYFENGDSRAALVQLRQTRKRDPQNAVVAELLPHVLLVAANDASKADELAEALRLVEELIMLQPSLDNRMWRVRLLIARQRNTQARQELRNILYANPDYFPARDLIDRLR